MYFGASHRGVGGEWADASCAFNKQASQTNNENCRQHTCPRRKMKDGDSLNTVHHNHLPGGRFKGDSGSRRLENGEQMPVLTSRNGKRMFRVDSGVEACQRPDAGGVAAKART